MPVDVAGPKAERPHGLEDACGVPRGARLDDRLPFIVDQVDGPEAFLLEHPDVCEVGLCIERQALEGHRTLNGDRRI